MAHEHIVYGLRLKGDDAVRYIGRTAYSAEHRLHQHMIQARRNHSGSPIGRWLRENADRVEAFRLAANEDREVIKAAERTIITVADALGCNLFNYRCITRAA